MNIPEKHPDVAHVSDALWEAAIALACDRQCYICASITNWEAQDVIGIIDHARCLILLGEVKKPVDPLDVALRAMFEERNGTILGDKTQTKQLASWHSNRFEAFCAQCRKHFAGLTFPEVKP